jgi:SHS2 domain-containing protein
VFEYFSHTADVGIKVNARDLKELFAESAKAVFNLITDISKVRPEEEFVIEEDGIDLENLLYRWIEDLIALHDSKNYVFSKFEVIELDMQGMRMKARVYGEKFDRERHLQGIVVKAMTYSQMSIVSTSDGYMATFVVDI